MAKSKNGLVATGLTVISFILILIAFSTSNWLETDGKLKDPKFKKLGLWEVCFSNFEETHFWYDFTFRDCWWIYEEEYYIILDFIQPGFFVAVQFFFTLCFALHLLALLSAALYMECSRENDRYVSLLLFLGTVLETSALSGTIAVYIFGSDGDSRVWMPNWEHNNIGWSYAVGVVGVIGTWVAGCLYLIEARRHHIKKSKADVMHAAYQMEETPRQYL